MIKQKKLNHGVYSTPWFRYFFGSCFKKVGGRFFKRSKAAVPTDR